MPIAHGLGQHRHAGAAVQLLLVGGGAFDEGHGLRAGVEGQQVVEAGAGALGDALQLLQKLGRIALQEGKELFGDLPGVVPAHGGVASVEEGDVALQNAVDQVPALAAVVRAPLPVGGAADSEEWHISHGNFLSGKCGV